MFQKAERKKARLRLALCGPAGSGKTYSALQIAKGLGGRIALIDTEHESGSLYADLCEFDTASLTPPYTPEKYRNAIAAAEAAGYSVLIIDSFSHAWAGEGGLLDMHDKAAAASCGAGTASRHGARSRRSTTPLSKRSSAHGSTL